MDDRHDPEHQYTIRGVPKPLDIVVRRQAKEEGMSLNRFAIRALENEVGQGKPRENHDLDWLCGTWVEDPETDRALEEQRRVDPDLWS